MKPKEAVTNIELQDKWLTIEELSSYPKICRNKPYRIVQKHELPDVKIGGRWLFD